MDRATMTELEYLRLRLQEAEEVIRKLLLEMPEHKARKYRYQERRLRTTLQELAGFKNDAS